MKVIKTEREKGSVLVMAVVLSFALFVTGLSFLTSVDYFENTVSDEVSRAKNIYAGNYGIQHKNRDMKEGNPVLPGPGEYKELDNGAQYRTYVVYTGHNQGGGYVQLRGYVVYADARTSFYGAGYEIEGTSGAYEILETFADYLYLSNCEEDPVRNDHIYFWGPDTLDGKVHSNDTLYTQSGYGQWPVFKKRVTSSASVLMPYNSQATFEEGLYLDADSIIFPDQAEEVRDNSFRSNFGFTNPDSITELTFDGNHINVRYCGYVYETSPPSTTLVCNLPSISEPNEILTIPPGDAALFVHGKVFVKASRGRPDLMDGIFMSHGFKGRLTVASSDTMVIYDNLIYQDANIDNTIPFTCNDVLGLISETAIMMGDSCHDTLYVNAAMATIGNSNGAISVRDIYHYGPSITQPNNNEKQSLSIHGSLAMKNRGLVHTSYLGLGVRGFIEKDYKYDQRLQLDPPPYFIKTYDYNSVYFEVEVKD
jgi:hypothetical protein